MNRLRTAVDVHQHLWPEGLVAALRARRRSPRLRGWTLELPGEPDYPVDPDRHDVETRAAEAEDDGLDLALVGLSSPLGIESLPADEAGELLSAYHDGVLAMPAPFGGWAAACLTEVDPAALQRELDRGFVGLQLPATALLDAQGYDRVGPLLEVLARTGRPLLVHPGPADAARAGSVAGSAGSVAGSAGSVAGSAGSVADRGGSSAGSTGSVTGSGAAVADRTPAWWPAVVSYVQQMHAAWFAFRAYGRPQHPDLRVCFALLAGLAPLHGERVAARTGERSPVDPNVFLEISSYGTRALDATIRVLGVDVLVNGSDRPYADPVRLELGPAAAHALRSANPMRLLYAKEVSHEVAVAAYA